MVDARNSDAPPLPRLIERIWNRKINPGKVFDLTLPLDQVAEGYRAMDGSRALQALLLPAPTAEYEEEEWNRIIDINLRGVFLCMKYEIPLILKQGGGAIVNTSSGAGVIGIKGAPRTQLRSTV